MSAQSKPDGQTKAVRLNYIMRVIHDEGHATVSDLGNALGVSDVTIRKDLQLLVERGFIMRTHGGAVMIDHYVRDKASFVRERENVDEKKRIGRAAAALVDDEDTLILDSGSAALEVVPWLHGLDHLVVITASLKVALELLRLQGAEIIMLGGLARSTTSSVVGPTPERMLSEHSVRKLILAADGLDVDYGVTTPHVYEAQLNRTMIDAADRTYVVADATRIGRRGISRICGLEEIDAVVVDDRVSEPTVRELERYGVRVIVV